MSHGTKAMTPASSTPPAAPVPEAATQEQKLRVEATELAVGVLDESKVPFLLFASSDAPGESMRFIQGSRFTYATDLDKITQETRDTKSSILWMALKTLSLGLRGGIVVLAEDTTPIYVFRNGEGEKLDPSDVVA